MDRETIKAIRIIETTGKLPKWFTDQTPEERRKKTEEAINNIEGVKYEQRRADTQAPKKGRKQVS